MRRKGLMMAVGAGVASLAVAVALAAPGGSSGRPKTRTAPEMNCPCACGETSAGGTVAPRGQRGVMGQGMMGRGGMGGGMMGNAADMHLAHELLAGHETIRRTVTQLPNGVETVTTSTDPQLAARLPEHVRAMYARLKEGRLIRGFDPLFVALFQNGDKIHAAVTPLPNGVKVVETSNDPYAVKLIKAHAAAVDEFVKNGMAAMHQTTPAPPRDAPARR
jgi:hypothetical protein